MDTKDLKFIYRADDYVLKINSALSVTEYELTAIQYNDNEHSWVEHTFIFNFSEVPTKLRKLVEAVSKREENSSGC